MINKFPMVLPDFSMIRFEKDRQFHVLKHFISIDESYRKNLALTGKYVLTEIDEKLQMIGSKFNPSFSSSPEGLIERIRTRSHYSITRFIHDEGRLEVQFLFKKRKYPQGIGWDNLVPLEQVRDMSDIFTQTKDHFPMLCIKGIPPATWILNLVAYSAGEEVFINTCFPGRYAPPLPDSSVQLPVLFQESVAFWENHVFIVPWLPGERKVS
jgi:hypothetical protein